MNTQLSRARTGSGKTHLHSWLAGLLNVGLLPNQHIVEWRNKDNWKDAEIYWIEYFKNAGYKLVNHSIGGDGPNGRVMSKEEREMRSEIYQRRWDNATIDERNQHKSSIKSYWNSPEGKEKARNITLKRFADPNERERHSDIMKQVTNSDSWRKNASKVTSIRYLDPKEREKTSIATKKARSKKESRQKTSAITTRNWENPAYRKKVTDGVREYWRKKKLGLI